MCDYSLHNVKVTACKSWRQTDNPCFNTGTI